MYAYKLTLKWDLNICCSCVDLSEGVGFYPEHERLEYNDENVVIKVAIGMEHFTFDVDQFISNIFVHRSPIQWRM